MNTPSLVTLRDLERARMIPQELPDRKPPARRETCAACGHPTTDVVITTGGPYADARTWETYPVAIDGWRCERCESLGFPVDLTPEAITRLCDDGVAAARAGHLDEGELALRRAIASWPGYSPPRVNLGALYLDRIRAERAGPNRPEAIRRLAAECEHHLRRARAGQPATPPEAAFMLARLLASTGRADEARALFTEVCDAPAAPAALRSDAMMRLAELANSGGSTALGTPAAVPAKRRRVMPWHILALMFGGAGLLMSLAIATTGTFAYAFPIISALLVAWFVSRLLPLWAAAILPVVVAILAIMNVHGVESRQRADQEVSMLGYATKDVCDGKPLGRDPTGPRMREFESNGDQKFWHESVMPDGQIPAYVLCIHHDSEDVACGDFVDSAHPDRGSSRICSSRDIATATLRRTKTAEVVSSKSYRGKNPPPLTAYVTIGGAGSTRLGGDPVSYDLIYADFKTAIAQ